MGVVLQLRKPEAKGFPDQVITELVELSLSIRELEIIQRDSVTLRVDETQERAQLLARLLAKRDVLLESHCLERSISSARDAFTVYGYLNFFNMSSIRDDSELTGIIVRMQDDLVDVITRLVHWSELFSSDCERIRWMAEYFLDIEQSLKPQRSKHIG